MRIVEISTVSGKTFHADSVFMVPNSLEILADILAERLELPHDEILWLGSPAWVLSGFITDEIFRRTRNKIDSRRADDIRRLASLAEENGVFVPDPLITNIPTTDWRSLIGHHTSGRSIMQILPDKPGGFFGGGEGNFAGISRSREAKAKQSLRDYDDEYVVSQWTPLMRFRFFGEEFELPKDMILAFDHVEFSADDMMKLRSQRSGGKLSG